MEDGEAVDRRIKELEAQLKEQELLDKRSARPLIAQSFLTSLPIVLTILLGFIANHFQSQAQHRKQVETLKEQGSLERVKQDAIAREAARVRAEQADNTLRLQEREAAARLAQQDREFRANSAAAALRFAQEQLTLRTQHAQQAAQQRSEFTRSLERQRRQNEADLLLQVIRVGDLAVARANIDFLLSAGLVSDPTGRIALAARQQTPVLPTPSGDLQVRIPDVSTAEGARTVDAITAGLAANSQRAPASGELRRLIEAIGRERSIYSVRELAVMLALIEDETGGTYRPTAERCNARYLRAMRVEPPARMDERQCFELAYGPGSRRAAVLGNTEPGDGYLYRGRGYFNITGRANYARAAAQWRTDYVGQPDLLMEPTHAFRAVLTFFEPGLRRLRAHPQFATAGPDSFPYGEAIPQVVRGVRGGLVGADRITARARQIELLLRETLPAAR